METGDPSFTDDLTDEQYRFCEGFVLYENIELAWEHATGQPLSVDGRKQAMRWFRMGAVKHTILELQSADQRLAHVNEEEHLMMLGRIRNRALASGKFAIALSAEKARGTVSGLYSRKSAPKLTDKSIKDLSTDEIRRRLENSSERGITVIEGTVAKKAGVGEPS